ncbi:FtsH-binding integral membrane protein [Bradyrhizobium sp. i1.3.6]
MSNYDPNLTASGTGGGALAIDPGLRAYMLRIYNYMAAGVGLTAIVAWLTYQLMGPALLESPLMWVFILAPLGLVFFIGARINTLSVETARILFFVYAALVGVSLSTLLHIYTSASITRVFFIAAAMFGALSVFGYTTRRDLSAVGSFLFMGLIGIIVASLVNYFPEVDGARLVDLDRRRWRLCGTYGL